MKVLLTTMNLRAPTIADIPYFWTHRCDREAVLRVAFMPTEPGSPEAFASKWRETIADPTRLARTIVSPDEKVIGFVASFLRDGDAEVTYWLDRHVWGQGIGTRALAMFLPLVAARPLYGRVAADNVASRRVLERNGFVVSHSVRSFADARGAEIDELVLRLTESASIARAVTPASAG